MKHNYFVSWIVPKGDMQIGNCNIESDKKGEPLMNEIIQKTTELIPNAIILSITKLD